MTEAGTEGGPDAGAGAVGTEVDAGPAADADLAADAQATAGAGEAGTADAAAGSTEADVSRRVAAMLTGIGPVLGIDVGGTSTRAVLLEDGVPTQRFSSGPFNFLLDGDGVPRMAALVQAAHPAAVGIGVPGLARVPDAAANFAAAIHEASGVPATVASDATVAWLGAFVGGPGILVVAGTWAVAVGGGSYGELALVGGHGHLVGDEGGGYWIGRRALRAAIAAAEGSGPATALTDVIPKAVGGSLYELMVRVQRAPGDRSELARLAPLVGKCAEGPARDPVALAILADAASELTALVTALRQRFGDLPVAAAGGVFAIAPVWDAFQQATGAVTPLAPPQIGAALLVAQSGGA
jgi:glucosamine kinase